MSAQAELAEARRLGYRLRTTGGRLFIAPAPPSDIAERLRVVKPEIMAILRHEAEALAEGLEVSYRLKPGSLRDAAGADWAHVIETPERLRAFADMVAIRRSADSGRIPPRFTATAVCRWCGPVYVPPAFADREIGSCPWCLNRHRGAPIPHPVRAPTSPHVMGATAAAGMRSPPAAAFFNSHTEGERS